LGTEGFLQRISCKYGERRRYKLSEEYPLTRGFNLNKHCPRLSFAWTRRNLGEVLVDHELASLGDSYVNFVYSLAMSNKRGNPLGTKVKGSVLAEALRRSGLRECLPSGMSRHSLADAAESLIVYAWLSRCLSFDESVGTIERESDPVEGLSKLLAKIKGSITFP
jgi:hypothetical protein